MRPLSGKGRRCVSGWTLRKGAGPQSGFFLARSLKQHLQECAKESPGAVLAACLTEVHDVLDFFLALLDLSTPVRLSALNAVMTSRSGSRLLVQLQKEARARASVVAQASYGSAITKAIEKVRIGKVADVARSREKRRLSEAIACTLQIVLVNVVPVPGGKLEVCKSGPGP